MVIKESKYSKSSKARKARAPTPKRSTREDDLLERAKTRLKRAIDADDHNREAGVDDLEFLEGEHWDASEVSRRQKTGRPCLTINLLPKYVDKLVGDERQNRPKIKIRPADSKSDVHVAKIREGIINDIEYQSAADLIYDQAFEQMVSSGYGAWRVLTRYCEDNPFVQEIYLEAVPNPFVVYLDPNAKDLMGADAKWGFLLDKVPREEFRELYPDAGEPLDSTDSGIGVEDERWYADDTITVAEYFEVETEKVDMVQLEDGSVMTREEFDEQYAEWEDRSKEAFNSAIGQMLALENEGGGETGMGPGMGPGMPPGVPPMTPPMPPQMGMPSPMPPQGGPPSPIAAMGPQAPPVGAETNMSMGMAAQSAPGYPPPVPNTAKPRVVNSRTVDQRRIRQYIVTGSSIVGPKTGVQVPGSYIPLVLLKGKQRNIKGKTKVRSMIRNAKDPSRLFNYWSTSAAETIALAPKAPWLGTAKQFQGYEQDYALAHVENFPFMKFNPDPEFPGPPVRNHAGDPPIAIFTQAATSKDLIREAMGVSDVEVPGEVGPERTGAAVLQKQKPSEVGVFAFLDNLARGIVYTGRIINSMIPEVYDTERDVRIREFDEREYWMPINTTGMAALESVVRDPEKYDGMDQENLKRHIVKHGPNAKFNDVGKGRYEIRVTVGPSYATQRQEAAENMMRLATAMPQQMALAADLIVSNMDFKDAEEISDRLRKTLPPGLAKPKPGDPPPAPQPPPPAVLIQQARLDVEKAKIAFQRARLDVEKLKVVGEAAKGKQGIAQEVYKILDNVLAPDHPADQFALTQDQGGGGMGSGPTQNQKPPSQGQNQNNS